MNKGCQSFFDGNGRCKFVGEWDPTEIYSVLTIEGNSFWDGKRVLDIGANTCGLSVEIAKRGASVVALKPDAYGNTFGKSRDIVNDVVATEKLDLQVIPKGLYDAHEHKGFDVVLCLGLLYHFRYPQLTLDYLSTLKMDYLYLSTQVHPGESLSLVNRLDPSIYFPKDFFNLLLFLLGGIPLALF